MEAGTSLGEGSTGLPDGKAPETKTVIPLENLVFMKAHSEVLTKVGIPSPYTPTMKEVTDAVRDAIRLGLANELSPPSPKDQREMERLAKYRGPKAFKAAVSELIEQAPKLPPYHEWSASA